MMLLCAVLALASVGGAGERRMLVEHQSEGTIVDRIGAYRDAAQSDATFVAYLVHGKGALVERRATMHEIADRVSVAAGVLRDRDLEPGDRVVIALSTGLDFVVAFLASVAARVVAVPLPVPGPPRRELGLARLTTVLHDCGASAVVASDDRLWALREKVAPEAHGVRWLCPADLRTGREVFLGSPQQDDVAYLQYTSGSTATPRGVIVRHSNLIANVRQITEMLGGRCDGPAVNWAPHYHDMGLVLAICRPLLEGRSAILMAPVAFIERPIRWLEAMSAYSAVESCAPPFAYDLVARRATDEEVGQLDLSAWQHAIVGAEPIDRRLLDGFAARFASTGFRPSAFSPGYGLAEATLAATFRPAGLAEVSLDSIALRAGAVVFVPEGGGAATRVISCGHPAPDVDVRIVDPTTLHEVSPGELGEVWVAGDNVAIGYWDSPQATAEVFDAVIAGEPSTRGYLRTGDLGFDYQGELHIAGRLKDLVIIRGQNFLPHDLERTVTASSEVIRPGAVAAFDIAVDGSRGLAVVFEVASAAQVDFHSLVSTVRRALSERHGVAASLLVATTPQSLPKTSSGKLQRRLARQMLLDGDLTTLHRWAVVS